MTRQYGKPLAAATAYHLHWPIVAFLLLINIGFIALGLYLTLLSEGGDFTGRLAGLFCAGFFGLTLATTIGDLFIRGPVLIIDAQGIWDKRMSPRPIPWRELRVAYISTVRRSKFISLDLFDAEPYLPTPYTFRGVLARLNPLRNYTKVTIPTLPLTARAEEILAMIESYRAQALDSSSSRR